MAQTITTNIVINARTGNGFSAVGATLTELGSLVNGVSQELINFGKESVEVYRNYEMSMKDAEVALSTTYGRGTKELSDVMSQLDLHATEWAATTIFHTNDVANAISEMAHAGWDYDKIMSGMPAAMELAQAGSLDLSEAVNYIVKSTNAAGIEFEDLGNFIDLWTFAANSSASTIGEFGDAMLRMGSTMRFAADPEELMTLIAVTANAGAVGSEAGTMIRNSMMRLVAPTDKAKEAMASLGATSDETASLLDDQALAAANARLAASGFSAFDESGNLKNVLDIYRELYMSLGEVAGGFENIEQNQDALEILSAIFPTRTITEALTLLRGAAEGYDGLYEAMKGGDAEGYGEYAQDTMMNTLNGKIETFESKVERLKQAVGEELAPQLEGILGTLGGFVDTIAGLDEGTFGALVNGLEIIAAAGPTLLIAGGALRFIGAALNPITGAGLGIVGAIALINALQQLEDANFESKFGNLELNSEQVSSFLTGLASDFEEANAPIVAYQEALDAAVKSYQDASGEFKADLLTDMLTNTELSDDRIAELEGLGEKMIQSVVDGIEANYSEIAQGITNAFGGEGTEGENIDNPVWAQMAQLLEQGYAEDLARAEELSQQLRDAMTSAFKDGHLTSEEIANIQSIMDEQNQLLAEQQEIDNYVKRQEILRKGQTLGLEGIEKSAGAAKEQIEAEWEQKLTQQDRDYAQMSSYYDKAIENGWMVANTDGTEGQHVATQLDKTIALHELQTNQEAERYRWTASESGFIMQTMLEGIRGSDLAGTWQALEDLAINYREAGGIVTGEDAATYNNLVSGENSMETSHYLDMMVGYLGGIDRIQGFIDYYEGMGDTASAGQYRTLLDMYGIMGNGGASGNVNPEVGTHGAGDFSEIAGSVQQMATLLERNGTSLTPEGMIETLHDFQEANMPAVSDADMWSMTLGDSLYQQMNTAAISAGYKTVTEWVQAIEATNPQVEIEPQISETDTSMEDQTMNVVPIVDESAIQDLPPQPLHITPYIEGEDAASALMDQDVNVAVGGDTQQLSATIEAENGKELLSYVNGDVNNLHMSIMDEDGQTLTENVTGNTSQLAAAIAAYEGRTITVNIAGNRLFASGGRATTASIFGEAGPEWAIPEEHSARTAELLNAAREASGFTWPDLLGRFGGLNANPNSPQTTLVYSPTIQAADATGVEQVLLDDKKRLEKWWSEKQVRDEVEVYA